MKHIFAALLLTASASVFAVCATSVAELDNIYNGFSPTWIETTANDGKPLHLTISNAGNSLHLVFTKGGKPWARGNGSICGAGTSFSVRIPAVTWGEAAPRFVRGNRSANFAVRVNAATNRIRVSQGGWSGTFRPR